MTDARIAVELARANEQLRQEQETFDTQKRHDCQWFFLQLVLGYSSIPLLASVLAVSGWILFHPSAYTGPVMTFAGGAFLVDTMGLAATVWASVLRPNQKQRLGPVTRAGLGNTQTLQVVAVDVAVGDDT